MQTEPKAIKTFPYTASLNINDNQTPSSYSARTRPQTRRVVNINKKKKKMSGRYLTSQYQPYAGHVARARVTWCCLAAGDGTYKWWRKFESQEKEIICVSP